MAAGYRSQAARYLGGAAVSPSTVGYRSMLARGVGGAAASVARPGAGSRSILCFWLGGACAPFVPVPPIPIPPTPPLEVAEGGLPFATHKRRRFIDDNEVLEFLEWWTAWNDVE